MKKAILILLFLSIGVHAYSQPTKIVYIIPDSVEVSIAKQIMQLKKDTINTIIYFLLEKDNEGIYSLSLFHELSEQVSGLSAKILKQTNRVLLVNQNKYPLLFDYDFTFGTPKDNEIGAFGNREGNVVRSTILFHGYTIYFNKSGKIIKVSDF